MAKVKTATNDTPPMRPAINTEAREQQMIYLAIDLAEKQLRDGTASSQVITHYLKLASTRERLERELLEKEVELKAAKTKALESSERIEKLYKDALSAMKNYSGHGDPDEY